MALQPAARKSDVAVAAWSKRSVYPASPRSPTSTPRQTQRYAADRLLDALRKHTALLPENKHIVHSIDEVLALGASAVFALAEESQAAQQEIGRLRGELAAAYRASAIAAAADVNTARREVEDEKTRSSYAEQQAKAREADLESAVLHAHSQLAEAQRARAAVQRGAERSAAAAKLLEQRLEQVREAARQVLHSLPSSTEEEAFEAERLQRVASGETVPREYASADEHALLARALERAVRCGELTRAAEAEVKLVNTELEAERAAQRTLRDELQTLLDSRQQLLDDKARLKREAADAIAARDSAEEAARRFQNLLFQQQQQLQHHHEILQRQRHQEKMEGPEHLEKAAKLQVPPPPLVPSPFVPASAFASSRASSPRGSPSSSVAQPTLPLTDSAVAAAAMAVDGLETAVREAAAMTALLSRPASALGMPIA